MKKLIFKMLLIATMLSVLTSCNKEEEVLPQSTPLSSSQETTFETTIKKTTPTTIKVSTIYDASDSNYENYQKYIKEFQDETGHTIIDESGEADEQWKESIIKSFDNGTNPDVIFFFAGADADKLIEQNLVVPIETIRKEYPNYGTNMKEALIPNATYDGNKYAIPVNGFWEGLYYNIRLLEESGIAIPDKNYNYEQFMKDCETLKNNGVTPIASALNTTPHYWFEYCIYNEGNSINHTQLPNTPNDKVALKWADGINEIKNIYEKGYFNKNTLDINELQSIELFCNEEAAFFIDGSWRLRTIDETAENSDNFRVTHVPAPNNSENKRATTDIIGGLSMGYFITTEAWEDETKRDACVEFVQKMTSNEVVSVFGGTSVTALKTGTNPPVGASELEISAIDMTKTASSITPATQDGFALDTRLQLFANISNVLKGEITAIDAITLAMTNESNNDAETTDIDDDNIE